MRERLDGTGSGQVLGTGGSTPVQFLRDVRKNTQEAAVHNKM